MHSARLLPRTPTLTLTLTLTPTTTPTPTPTPRYAAPAHGLRGGGAARPLCDRLLPWRRRRHRLGAPATCCLLLAACYLLLATCYLPTCYLLLATCYLLRHAYVATLVAQAATLVAQAATSRAQARMLDASLGGVLKQKRRAEAAVRASSLDWTIVRPGARRGEAP